LVEDILTMSDECEFDPVSGFSDPSPVERDAATPKSESASFSIFKFFKG
jgi:hypothetical protein